MHGLPHWPVPCGTGLVAGPGQAHGFDVQSWARSGSGDTFPVYCSSVGTIQNATYSWAGTGPEDDPSAIIEPCRQHVMQGCLSACYCCCCCSSVCPSAPSRGGISQVRVSEALRDVCLSGSMVQTGQVSYT